MSRGRFVVLFPWGSGTRACNGSQHELLRALNYCVHTSNNCNSSAKETIARADSRRPTIASNYCVYREQDQEWARHLWNTHMSSSGSHHWRQWCTPTLPATAGAQDPNLIVSSWIAQTLPVFLQVVHTRTQVLEVPPICLHLDTASLVSPTPICACVSSSMTPRIARRIPSRFDCCLLHDCLPEFFGEHSVSIQMHRVQGIRTRVRRQSLTDLLLQRADNSYKCMLTTRARALVEQNI
eukprot:1883697-Amphidinium_carterae.5